MKIPITRPFFDECEKTEILKPLETGWIVQGPEVAEFERLFAAYTGSSYARAASSCTTALHLALDALGITIGDKVIVPAFTYVASANAVEYTGADVELCDIDLKTFNIDIKKAEAILENDKSRQIKAIVPVHLFGLCTDMKSIMALAQKHHLKVIEDAACGFGAWIDGKHGGTFGDAGCFSFHPRKSITTGEGGMVITENREVAEKVTSLRDHGAGRADLERHMEKGGSLLPEFNLRGYNYRMTDLQAALGVCQMKKADFILKERRKWAEMYDQALKGIHALVTPYTSHGYIHGYQAYVCLFTNGEDISTLTKDRIDRINTERNRFMEELENRGIATRQGTHAVHTLGYYKNKHNIDDKDFINAYGADRLSIALPLYATMTEKEFDYIIENIKSLL
jgi:perosamine synthetase